ELDLALTFDYSSLPAGDERDVDRVLLMTESMYVALPRNHPLAGRAKVNLADLEDEAWLCGIAASSCGEAIKAACRAAGFEPRIAFESDDHHVLQGFVAANLGVTLLPDLALPTLRDDIVVRPTDPPADVRRVWATTRPEGARSAATDAMREILTELGDTFAREQGRIASGYPTRLSAGIRARPGR